MCGVSGGGDAARRGEAGRTGAVRGHTGRATGCQNVAGACGTQSQPGSGEEEHNIACTRRVRRRTRTDNLVEM